LDGTSYETKDSLFVMYLIIPSEDALPHTSIGVRTELVADMPVLWNALTHGALLHSLCGATRVFRMATEFTETEPGIREKHIRLAALDIRILDSPNGQRIWEETGDDSDTNAVWRFHTVVKEFPTIYIKCEHPDRVWMTHGVVGVDIIKGRLYIYFQLYDKEAMRQGSRDASSQLVLHKGAELIVLDFA